MRALDPSEHGPAPATLTPPPPPPAQAAEDAGTPADARDAPSGDSPSVDRSVDVDGHAAALHDILIKSRHDVRPPVEHKWVLSRLLRVAAH